MAARNESVPSAGDMVVIKRVFDAPRELVFRAWTDPEWLARWYAPNGCSILFRWHEARPGGAFQSCIRTPDGNECWCKGTYREVMKPERLVFTMTVSDADGSTVEPADVGMDPDWPRETVVTVTFAEHGGKTLLTLHQTVSESLAKRTGAYPSWIEMLAKLAGELTQSAL